MDDLESIAGFISKDSFHYARLFVVEVIDSIEILAHFPRSCRTVPELKNPSVREIILGNYRIVYRLKDKVVEILTVYHGAKLLPVDKLKKSS